MATTQKHYLKINPYLDIISGISVVLSFSDGIIKIIGRQGAGKSVLNQLLADELQAEDLEVVIFPQVPGSLPELHGPIQQQLNLDSRADFHAALSKHIHARPFDQQKLILIFDDAEQISDACYQGIRDLFHKNQNGRPLVSMVLTGTDQLDQKLNEPANRTFNKNIILNFEVKSMTREELGTFCHAYLAELGLQHKHQLNSKDIDDIFQQTGGLPGRVAELIFEVLDRKEEERKVDNDPFQDKGILGKVVKLDDDPEPELSGLSVEDREVVLTAFKDQIPWRWQSNGVGIAVVVLFLVVLYGWFIPEDERSNSIVIFPPPTMPLGQALVSAPLAPTGPGISTTATVPEPADEVPVPAADDLAGEPGLADDLAPAPTVADAAEDSTPAIPDTPIEAIPESTDPEPAVADADIAQPPVPEVEIADNTPPVTEPEPADIAAGNVGPAPAEPATAAPDAEPEPAVPAPAPDVAVTSSPAVPPSRMDPRTFVEDWLDAWERQDLAAYFAAYSSDFTPPGSPTRENWEAGRTRNITSPSAIDIDIEEFEILAQDAGGATLRLAFTYQSPNYADRTVKEIALSDAGGEWVITRETILDVTRLDATVETPDIATGSGLAGTPPARRDSESGFDARIRQVMGLAMDNTQPASEYQSFINDWLGAWRSKDIERYFRHYHHDFQPAYHNSLNAWRADRLTKIRRPQFIEVALDDFEILSQDEQGARVRFWMSYASSYYLDRTLKEVLISGHDNSLGILQERNLAIEIIPFYP